MAKDLLLVLMDVTDLQRLMQQMIPAITAVKIANNITRAQSAQILAALVVL